MTLKIGNTWWFLHIRHFLHQQTISHMRKCFPEWVHCQVVWILRGSTLNSLILWWLWKESLNSGDHQFHQYQQNQKKKLLCLFSTWPRQNDGLHFIVFLCKLKQQSTCRFWANQSGLTTLLKGIQGFLHIRHFLHQQTISHMRKCFPEWVHCQVVCILRVST
jgi:hypothetical protein